MTTRESVPRCVRWRTLIATSSTPSDGDDSHTAGDTPDRWDDDVRAFGRRGGKTSWCWCQRFMDPPAGAPTDNRAALHQEIESASVPPGVLAYVDATPRGGRES
ncbi:MAG: hypothetical protein QOF30_196 [Acidimicrobiaceae bacterium]|nr:hypothetical protein [Acidimicrobiaceae bacterium]